MSNTHERKARLDRAIAKAHEDVKMTHLMGGLGTVAMVCVWIIALAMVGG